MPLLCSVRLPWFSQAPLRARLPLAAGVDASAPGPGSSLRQRPGLSHPGRARDLGDNMNAAASASARQWAGAAPGKGGLGQAAETDPFKFKLPAVAKRPGLPVPRPGPWSRAPAPRPGSSLSVGELGAAAGIGARTARTRRAVSLPAERDVAVPDESECQWQHTLSDSEPQSAHSRSCGVVTCKAAFM
jgi:hypothetical protein